MLCLRERCYKDEDRRRYLDGEAFDYHFDNFTEDKPTNEEARSFQKVKAALLEKFTTKKTKVEVKKEAVNLVYKGDNFKEFFVNASKLYKAANFNDQAKFGLVGEAMKSDQGMLQFESLRKGDTYEKVREICIEYANNQKVFASQGEQVIDQAKSGDQESEKNFTRKLRKRKTNFARSLSSWRN